MPAGARPHVGLLSQLLKSRSKDAKAAIQAHLAPSVAKGSVSVTRTQEQMFRC